jgi:hypothetical protein
MDTKSETNGYASDAEADAAFLKENIDIKYLKKAVDIEIVNSLLGQFAPATVPPPTPETPIPEKAKPEKILEPKQEKSILSRIKNFWRRTDRKIKATDNKVKDLQSLHEKAREVQTLKQQYESSLSEKLGKNNQN